MHPIDACIAWAHPTVLLDHETHSRSTVNEPQTTRADATTWSWEPASANQC